MKVIDTFLKDKKNKKIINSSSHSVDWENSISDHIYNMNTISKKRPPHSFLYDKFIFFQKVEVFPFRHEYDEGNHYVEIKSIHYTKIYNIVTSFIDFIKKYYNKIIILNFRFGAMHGHIFNDIIPNMIYLDKYSDADLILCSNSKPIKDFFNLSQYKFKKIKFIDKSSYFYSKNISQLNVGPIGGNAKFKKSFNPIHRNYDNILSFKKFLSENCFLNNLAEKKNRLIYCSRNGSTDAKNGRQLSSNQESQIKSILQDYCSLNDLEFTFFNGQLNNKTMSMLDQIKIFSEASIVVGNHGGAMSNCIFLNPKNKPFVCEFCCGLDTNFHGSQFSQNFNRLFDFALSTFCDYYLIPFTQSSNVNEVTINLEDLKLFLNQIS